MAYSKTNWVNNTTPINETNLNKIEQGIYDNSLVVDAVTNTLNPTDTETYKTAELTEGQITDVIGVNDILIKGQTSQNGEPTPATPQDIHVVSGDNKINVVEKNLYNKNKDDVGHVYTSTGSYSEASVWTTSDWISVNSGETYSLSSKTTGTINMFFSEFDKDKTFIQRTNTNTLTPTTNTKYVRLSYKNDIGTYDIQIEKGSTATTYAPYQSQTYPINLGSLELCKIGDYQDYFYKSGSKWYLHKEINKITSYNGETITTSYISTTGKLSTGAKVYYVVTPTDTKITDTTLISQLEAIYNAPLYEQTNITQTNNDLPMVLDITAYKDNINGIKALLSDANEIKSVLATTKNLQTQINNLPKNVKQVWGKSISFKMQSGQHALVMINFSDCLMVWMSGAGMSLTRLYGSEAQVTSSGNTVTINFADNRNFTGNAIIT